MTYMRVQFEVPDHAMLIERLLDGFIQANEILYRSGAAKGPPSITWELFDDGSPEVWKLANECEEDGIVDCEDLVCAWAGYLRASGKDPGASARIATVGPRKVHCLLLQGDGKIVDIWELHRQKQQQFQMAGLFSAIKKVGKGIGKAASAVGSGVKTAAVGVGKGVKGAAVGVGKGASWVAKDLPKKVLSEGADGLTSLVRGVGDAGSSVLNAVGDEVARGAGDALSQWGKLGKQVIDVLSPAPAQPTANPVLELPPGPTDYGYDPSMYPPEYDGGGIQWPEPPEWPDDAFEDAGDFVTEGEYEESESEGDVWGDDVVNADEEYY